MNFSDASGERGSEIGNHSAPEPFLSVAICSRNRAALLRRAIDHVLPQLRTDTELLIVDNASTDDTPRIIAAAGKRPNVRPILESKRGLSIARNRALTEARGKYVLFLDDDAVPEPGWLDAYCNFLAQPPSPRLAVAGGAVHPEFETRPPRWLGPAEQASTLDLGNQTRQIREHHGPWGCNIAYHRAAAIRAGKFNPDLGRNGTSLGAHEELDLNLRLEKSGGEVWWVPGAGIRHFVGSERLRLRRLLRSEFTQSRSKVIMKLRSMPTAGRRIVYCMSRILVAPFQCAFYLLLALVSFPVQHGHVAAIALVKAARVAGKTSESIYRLCLPNPRDPAPA